MANEETVWVRVDVAYALWPGDGVFCTRISGEVFKQPLFQLHDREGRVHELRPYRLGMPVEPRR
jgi:hypothetical protein